jgi:hypothetical protein
MVVKWEWAGVWKRAGWVRITVVAVEMGWKESIDQQ